MSFRRDTASFERTYNEYIMHDDWSLKRSRLPLASRIFRVDVAVNDGKSYDMAYNFDAVYWLPRNHIFQWRGKASPSLRRIKALIFSVYTRRRCGEIHSNISSLNSHRIIQIVRYKIPSSASKPTSGRFQADSSTDQTRPVIFLLFVLHRDRRIPVEGKATWLFWVESSECGTMVVGGKETSAWAWRFLWSAGNNETRDRFWIESRR